MLIVAAGIAGAMFYKPGAPKLTPKWQAEHDRAAAAGIIKAKQMDKAYEEAHLKKLHDIGHTVKDQPVDTWKPQQPAIPPPQPKVLDADKLATGETLPNALRWYTSMWSDRFSRADYNASPRTEAMFYAGVSDIMRSGTAAEKAELSKDIGSAGLQRIDSWVSKNWQAAKHFSVLN